MRPGKVQCECDDDYDASENERQWISVNDRLPEKNRAVLFCYYDESLEVELGYFDGKVWISGKFNWTQEDVPFWMLIPEPPELENLDTQTEVPCKTHPDAPHGFMRSDSHEEGRYVCECEYWEPPTAK